MKKGWRSKDLEWLIAAGLVYKVCKIEKPFLPLSSYADDTSFKLYMADIGILRKLSKLPYLEGKRVQLIDIYYNGVGILRELTPEEMEEAFQNHMAERKAKTA